MRSRIDEGRAVAKTITVAGGELYSRISAVFAVGDSVEDGEVALFSGKQSEYLSRVG